GNGFVAQGTSTPARHARELRQPAPGHSRFLQPHARRTHPRARVSTHRQSLFLHRPPRRLDFLGESLRHRRPLRARRERLALGFRPHGGGQWLGGVAGARRDLGRVCENIQHPTSNIQHPMNLRLPRHWMLDVGCWMLDVPFVSTARTFANAALGFLYPEVCQICAGERALPADGYVGDRCRQHARYIVPPFCDRCGLPFEGDITTTFECGNCREMELHFCSARSAVKAKGTVLEVIHRYKYQRALWFEPFLAGLFVRQAVPELQRGQWDLIVPVPLHAAKLRQREFNQAERLAKRLGAAANICVDARLLKRVVPTRT